MTIQEALAQARKQYGPRGWVSEGRCSFREKTGRCNAVRHTKECKGGAAVFEVGDSIPCPGLGAIPCVLGAGSSWEEALKGRKP